MTDSEKLNQVLETGIHNFGDRTVTVDYIEDDGDWAVIDIESGHFIASSPFSAAEALTNAEWLAGGPLEMDEYISEVLKRASRIPTMKLRHHRGRTLAD